MAVKVTVSYSGAEYLLLPKQGTRKYANTKVATPRCHKSVANTKSRFKFKSKCTVKVKLPLVCQILDAFIYLSFK